MGHGRQIRIDECQGKKPMNKFKLNIIGKNFDIELERQEQRKFSVEVNGKKYEAILQDDQGDVIVLAVDGGLFEVELVGEPSEGKMQAIVNNRERIAESADLLGSGKSISERTISTASEGEPLVEEEQIAKGPAGALNAIVAPLPGKVVAVKVNVGDDIKAGDVVIILEAMKMENEIISNLDGKIAEVKVKEGDTVDAEDVLVYIG